MKHASGPQLADWLSPERQARILAGAAIIFVAEGYEGASMSQIAASANVSKGTLYNYFPGKQALFAAFVQGRCAEFVHKVFGDLQDDAAIEPTLKRIGRVMLNTLLSPDDQAFFRVVMMEAGKFPELARAFLTAGPEVMVDRLSAWLRVQGQANRLQMRDPQFCAEQFFALTQTRVVMRSRFDPSYQISESEIEQVVDGAVQVFLAAYQRQPKVD